MIFSQEKYFETNRIKNHHLFVWKSHNSGAEASCIFSLENQKATSIPKAPYGGFLIDGNLTGEELGKMLDQLLADLRIRGIKSISINQNPVFFHSKKQTNNLYRAFKKSGFKKTEEINHHIDLSNLEDLTIHPMQKRRIKKCRSAGFTFQKEGNKSASETHDFTDFCRNQMGLKINMDKSSFLRVFKHLSDEYKIYTIRNQDDELVASTVTISITPNVMYNFLPAFDRNWSTYSPLSFLTYNLAHEAKKCGFSILDLGISSIQSKPQPSLIKFKKRMGGIQTGRLSFKKHI